MLGCPGTMLNWLGRSGLRHLPPKLPSPACSPGAGRSLGPSTAPDPVPPPSLKAIHFVVLPPSPQHLLLILLLSWTHLHSFRLPCNLRHHLEGYLLWCYTSLPPTAEEDFTIGIDAFLGE